MSLSWVDNALLKTDLAHVHSAFSPPMRRTWGLVLEEGCRLSPIDNKAEASVRVHVVNDQGNWEFVSSVSSHLAMRVISVGPRQEAAAGRVCWLEGWG